MKRPRLRSIENSCLWCDPGTTERTLENWFTWPLTRLNVSQNGPARELIICRKFSSQIERSQFIIPDLRLPNTHRHDFLRWVQDIFKDVTIGSEALETVDAALEIETVSQEVIVFGEREHGEMKRSDRATNCRQHRAGTADRSNCKPAKYKYRLTRLLGFPAFRCHFSLTANDVHNLARLEGEPHRELKVA